MKLFKIIRVVLAVFILAGACKSDSYNYTIEDYKLTFEPIVNSTDLKARIEITYLVETGKPKSDGFKFVGNSKVDSLVCTDENGIIASKIEYLKETKLIWQFQPVSSGLKTVRAEFILRDFVTNDGGKYTIDAPWAKVFRVPVKKATFRVCFPLNPATVKFYEPEIWDSGNLGSCYSAMPKQTNKKVKLQYEF